MPKNKDRSRSRSKSSKTPSPTLAQKEKLAEIMQLHYTLPKIKAIKRTRKGGKQKRRRTINKKK